MKKAIFSVMMAFLLVCASLSSFGLKTNTEIYNIIQMSKEYNSLHGIKNPNEIWPGQTLTFLFQDHTWQEVVVEEGDNQWTIVRDKLDTLQNEHGEIISPIEDSIVPLPQPKQINSSIMEPFPWWWSFPWGWLLLALAVLAIAIKLLQILYKERRQNPVTAGTPQVNGGVRNNEAYSRMNQVAQNRFPGSQIVIKNIRRGWLSGWAHVFYANDKTKRLKLKDVAAYSGEAMINGREQTIYFLQGCGNDARGGNYMTGDLEFRPDVIVNQDGSESPLPAESAEITETEQVVEEQIPITTPVILGSETHQQRMKILEIVGSEIIKGDVHEVNIDTTSDKFDVHIKYKFAPVKKTTEKKE
jgi:hypothetical protein